LVLGTAAVKRGDRRLATDTGGPVSAATTDVDGEMQ